MTMLREALERMNAGENGQFVPVSVPVQTERGVEKVQSFELQWVERDGVDPMDRIVCRYRVTNRGDIAKIQEAVRNNAAPAQLIR